MSLFMNHKERKIFPRLNQVLSEDQDGRQMAWASLGAKAYALHANTSKRVSDSEGLQTARRDGCTVYPETSLGRPGLNNDFHALATEPVGFPCCLSRDLCH